MTAPTASTPTAVTTNRTASPSTSTARPTRGYPRRPASSPSAAPPSRPPSPSTPPAPSTPAGTSGCCTSPPAAATSSTPKPDRTGTSSATPSPDRPTEPSCSEPSTWTHSGSRGPPTNPTPASSADGAMAGPGAAQRFGPSTYTDLAADEDVVAGHRLVEVVARALNEQQGRLNRVLRRHAQFAHDRDDAVVDVHATHEQCHLEHQLPAFGPGRQSAEEGVLLDRCGTERAIAQHACRFPGALGEHSPLRVAMRERPREFAERGRRRASVGADRLRLQGERPLTVDLDRVPVRRARHALLRP